MNNGWIKLSCNRTVVTLPATFKLIAESEMRINNIEFDCIIDMCDIRYRCKQDEYRKIYSLAYLKEEIDKINKFSKDIDNDTRRLLRGII